MVSEKFRILHIDTEKTWRGGENQLRLLLEGGKNRAEWFLAAPRGSEAAKRLRTVAEIVPLANHSLGLVANIPHLVRFCRQRKIQLIDCQTSKAHSLALAIKRRLPNIKLVVHRRVDFAPGNGFFNRQKYFSTHVDRYIAISQAIASILQDYGISASKISRVPSAVDPRPLQQLNPQHMRKELQEEFGIGDVPIIVNVAYHTHQKGHHTLLRALGRLATQGIPFFCLLAGKGPLTKELTEFSYELQLQNYIRFLGIRDDVPRLLVGSDIFALPSNYEGLGTSILDAIYSRCAVAASNVGGIPEMIEHEITGLLSPVGDDVTHAENLAKLIADSQWRYKLQDAALKKVEQNFSLTNMVEGNLNVYQDLLEN
jgi:glycosyltransferase involved in cell wall biosynthesis